VNCYLIYLTQNTLVRIAY